MREKSIALIVVIVVVGAIAIAFEAVPRVHRKPVVRPPNVLSPETKRILENGERLVLLAIQPLPEEEPGADPPPPLPGESEAPGMEKFHRYPVLGKIEIQDQKERADLLRALYKGMEGTYGFAPCFYPRHGLSATHGNDAVDLVICFECGVVDVYSRRGTDALAVSDSPQQTFDRALTKALSSAHVR